MKHLELYIHIPFCVKKCNYCDFLSYALDDDIKEKYIDVLLEEIAVKAKDYADRIVDTVFVGGGTPSILEVKHIVRIFEALHNHFSFANDAEITIECNPGTLDKSKLVEYKKCGINRLSIGLQSANDEELKILGRIHSYADFLNSFKMAREVGFNNINVDIIGALPGQDKEIFADTLRKVIALEPEHISSYELIIEEGTPFYEQYGNDSDKLPDEDTEREIYYATRETLADNGYVQYEISNYSKPGYECRHNIGYWTGKEYLGLGLGSSSYVDKERYKNVDSLEAYLKYNFAKYDVEILSDKDMMSEFMFLGLRMTCGVSHNDFRMRFGCDISEVWSNELEKMINDGLLECIDNHIRLTYKGMDVANYVMSEFV